MSARKWPTVEEVLERATQVENWWQGDPHTFYRGADGLPVKIHQRTVPRLLRGLVKNGWRVRDRDWRVRSGADSNAVEKHGRLTSTSTRSRDRRSREDSTTPRAVVVGDGWTVPPMHLDGRYCNVHAVVSPPSRWLGNGDMVRAPPERVDSARGGWDAEGAEAEAAIRRARECVEADDSPESGCGMIACHRWQH